MINVEKTIISQYANSPTLVQLIQNMNTYLDPRADFDAFFNFVWNVDTAQGFGLDIWGRIVNISREISIPDASVYFGFKDALPGSYPFNEAPFYDGTAPASQTYELSDDAYRSLIYVKALANISRANAKSINQLLRNLFSIPRTYWTFGNVGLDSFVLDQSTLDGHASSYVSSDNRCYVNDLGSMGMRYVFEFDLTPFEIAIIKQTDVLPRPSGVSVILFQSALPLFGFSEAGASAAPFGEGIFIPQRAINAIV